MTKLRYLSVIIFTLLIYSCNSDKQQISQATKDAAIRYAQGSQKVLAKGLMQAIESQGIVYAIGFCKDTAEILTHSISNVLNIEISRVSDKNRNPNNAATQEELSYILKVKAQLSKNEEIEPQYSITGDKVRAYIPITTKPLCLNCHGNPNHINAEVLDRINDLYPNDKAMNYNDKEVRGIWVVELQNITSD